MTGTHLLIFLSCVGVVFGVDSPAIPNCPQGVRFKDSRGCNWCTCHRENGAISCTKMACVSIPGQVRTEEVIRPFVADGNAPTEKCPKGLRHKDAEGCNNCWCDPEAGTTACTLMACLKHPITILNGPKRSSMAVYEVEGSSEESDESEIDLCPKGLNFKLDDGCNTCNCNPANGLVGCTRMACIKTYTLQQRPKAAFKLFKSNHGLKYPAIMY